MCRRLPAQLQTTVQLVRELGPRSDGRGFHRPVEVAVNRSVNGHAARTVSGTERRLEAHVNAGALSTRRMERISA